MSCNFRPHHCHLCHCIWLFGFILHNNIITFGNINPAGSVAPPCIIISQQMWRRTLFSIYFYYIICGSYNNIIVALYTHPPTHYLRVRIRIYWLVLLAENASRKEIQLLVLFCIVFYCFFFIGKSISFFIFTKTLSTF